MTGPVMFQALPPLSPEEYAELERSILEHGVMVPIVLDENGVVIDGHHRQQIAAHHDLACPSETKLGFTDAEKRGLALSLNLHRRHLTREQKRALVAESIKADPQLSDREHGRRTGVSHPTVANIREELETSGDVESFTTREDSSGRSQPASKPPKPPAPKPDPAVPAAEPSATSKPPVTDLISADDLAELNASMELNATEYETPEQAAARMGRERGPRKSSRAPLTDAFWRAAVDLRKNVERIERLVADDRFGKNSGQIAERSLSDLTRARDALQCVITQMTSGV